MYTMNIYIYQRKGGCDRFPGSASCRFIHARRSQAPSVQILARDRSSSSRRGTAWLETVLGFDNDMPRPSNLV